MTEQGPIPDGPHADGPPGDGPPDTTNPCADCPLGCHVSGTRFKVLVPLTRNVLQTAAIDQSVTGNCTLNPTTNKEFPVDGAAVADSVVSTCRLRPRRWAA